MKLLLLPNFTCEKTAQVVERVLRWSEISRVKILMEITSRSHVPNALHGDVEFLPALRAQALEGCRCVIAVGGDGTVVRCAQASARFGLPLVGIHTGTLGFLAYIKPAELEERLECIRLGQYTLERRFSLAASWPGGQTEFALNDIVLQKAVHDGLACLEAFCGNELIGSYRADGLILATPTGSTAYAYAAGGPVMDPSMEAISMLPICPQNRASFSLVCSPHRTLSVSVQKGTMCVLADGVNCGLLHQGESIAVNQAAISLQMLRFDDRWGIVPWQRKICSLESH